MGRFDPPPSDEVLSQQALHRIESALSALVDQMAVLGNLPAPQVHVAAPTMPNVEVPTEPMVNALARVMEEIGALANRPVELPPINVAQPTVEMDLAPLLDQQEQMRLTMEAVTEKVVSLQAGTKSHFDGRLRDRQGQVDFPRIVGTYGYAAGTSGTPTIPANSRVLSITATGPTVGQATMTIDGGDTIIIPASGTLVLNPEANLVSPALVFTGTLSYVVDWVR